MKQTITVGVRAVYNYQPYVIFAWRLNTNGALLEQYSVLTTNSGAGIVMDLTYDNTYSVNPEFGRLLWSELRRSKYYAIKYDDKAIGYLKEEIEKVQLSVCKQDNINW